MLKLLVTVAIYSILGSLVSKELKSMGFTNEQNFMSVKLSVLSSKWIKFDQLGVVA